MATINWQEILVEAGSGHPSNSPEPIRLSDTKIPPGGAQIEGQIGEGEDAYIGGFYREFLLPMVKQANIDVTSSRILELGCGFGKLAYGTFQNYSPKLYVATDVVPDLFPTLSDNLSRFAPESTDWGIAILDPQDRLLFRKGVFNIIQSHSVLHHVLNYRYALQNLFEYLPSPGILMFAEPFVDGYLLFCMIARIVSRRFVLSERLRQQLTALEQNVIARTVNRQNPAFLSQFGTGDKHIYSIYDLLEIADQLGARLIIQRDPRSLEGLFLGEFQLRGATASELQQIQVFLHEILPEGIEHAFFSDLRHIFSFVKSP